MKNLYTRQQGFAAPAMFVIVAIAFLGSLGVKGEDGNSVAQAMGVSTPKATEFASFETPVDADGVWIDE